MQDGFSGSNSKRKIYHYLGNSERAWHPCIGMHFTQGQRHVSAHKLSCNFFALVLKLSNRSHSFPPHRTFPLSSKLKTEEQRENCFNLRESTTLQPACISCPEHVQALNQCSWVLQGSENKWTVRGCSRRMRGEQASSCHLFKNRDLTLQGPFLHTWEVG